MIKKHPILIVHTKWNCQKMKKKRNFFRYDFQETPPKIISALTEKGDICNLEKIGNFRMN